MSEFLIEFNFWRFYTNKRFKTILYYNRCFGLFFGSGGGLGARGHLGRGCGTSIGIQVSGPASGPLGLEVPGISRLATASPPEGWFGDGLSRIR
jgi:hypothetical protein